MTDAKYTENFLHQISSHLSGRNECKGVEYVVTISKGNVFVEPSIKVCKNRYSRKESDKLFVETHIQNFHSNSENSLVDGTYKYILSNSRKRRRWMKLI